MKREGLNIPLAKPSVTEEEIEAVVRVLRSKALVQGSEVAGLEAEICQLTGAKAAVAVANGTVALELALRALGVGPGDEVIVPAFSFMATANAVESRGAKPVFVDISPDTFNIDPTLVERALKPRTKVLMPVHEFGLCSDMAALCDLSQRHGLPLLEDAACAIGSKLDGRHAGSFGILGTFSFHPRKIVTSGEGGMILCQDPALADRLRSFRNHGISPGTTPASFQEAGTNARLTDFQAAMARPQLRRIEHSIAARTAVAQHYLKHLHIEGARLPSVPAGLRPNWQTFHVVLPDRLVRDAVIATLSSQGIGTNFGAHCMPAQHYYVGKYGIDARTRFPNAWNAWRQGLALPIFEELSPEELSYVTDALNSLS